MQIFLDEKTKNKLRWKQKNKHTQIGVVQARLILENPIQIAPFRWKNLMGNLMHKNEVNGTCKNFNKKIACKSFNKKLFNKFFAENFSEYFFESRFKKVD